MRLVNVEYGISLKLDEGKTTILVIESKRMRMKILEDLYGQCQGETGDFVLSEDNQIVKTQKMMDILLGPFSLDCNNRKVLAKLYQEIRDCGNEDFFSEKEKINREILSLFDNIMRNVPYNITTTLDVDLMELCKVYNVRLEKTGDTLLEQLIDYMRAMNELCTYRVFILLNVTMYLENKDLNSLYEFAAYQKIYLLLIEYAVPELIADEKGCIIDREGCIIDIGKDNLQHLPDVKFGENQDGFEV